MLKKIFLTVFVMLFSLQSHAVEGRRVGGLIALGGGVLLAISGSVMTGVGVTQYNTQQRLVAGTCTVQDSNLGQLEGFDTRSTGRCCDRSITGVFYGGYYPSDYNDPNYNGPYYGDDDYDDGYYYDNGYQRDAVEAADDAEKKIGRRVYPLQSCNTVVGSRQEGLCCRYTDCRSGQPTSSTFTEEAESIRYLTYQPWALVFYNVTDPDTLDEIQTGNGHLTQKCGTDYPSLNGGTDHSALTCANQFMDQYAPGTEFGCFVDLKKKEVHLSKDPNFLLAGFGIGALVLGTGVAIGGGVAIATGQ